MKMLATMDTILNAGYSKTRKENKEDAIRKTNAYIS
jgi:hypothetical protein